MTKLPRHMSIQLRLSITTFPHGVFGDTEPVVVDDFLTLTPEQFFKKHLRARLVRLAGVVEKRAAKK